MSETFAHHLAIWDRLGEDDPFWAVLSDPDKRGGGWDPDAFFSTGREHIDRLEGELQSLSLSFAGRRVLDFGCGLGRLTQALAERAALAIGVDASLGMVVGAQRWNRWSDRCAYLINRSPDLSMLPDRSFDAVVSFIVLQHIPAPASHGYVAELARVVAPGGFLVVQVPAEQVMVELSDDAFRADFRLVDPPRSLQAGQTEQILVAVRNTSEQPWTVKPADRLKLGNHWVALDGGPSARDDGRVVLEPLEPGTEVTVRLPVTGPGMPGRYRLEVEVVVEGQAWFADRGVAPAAADVAVTPKAPARPVASAPAAPDHDAPVSFGMFGIPRAEVVRLLEEAGLDVVEITPDGSAGDDWTSWRYVAVRRP